MTFTPDPAGIDAILAGTQPALHELCESIAAEARRDGPRNPLHTDHSVDKIHVGQFRVTAQGAEQDIDWDDEHFWHLVEFGSAHNPPARPLTRAAQNHGLTVVDRGSH